MELPHAEELTGWRMPSYSHRADSSIMVTRHAGGVALASSRTPAQPFLWLTSPEWADFLDAAAAGEFDDLAWPVIPEEANGCHTPRV